MSNATQVVATLDDLYRVEGKAELIAGRIVYLMPTGRKPSRVASRSRSLVAVHTLERLKTKVF